MIRMRAGRRVVTLTQIGIFWQSKDEQRRNWAQPTPTFGEIDNLAPRYFPAEPFWRPIQTLTIHAGKGECLENPERLSSFCSSPSPGDRVPRITGHLFLELAHRQLRNEN
jgi:hypothetical protein